jgi:hypothetical protein
VLPTKIISSVCDLDTAANSRLGARRRRPSCRRPGRPLLISPNKPTGRRCLHRQDPPLWANGQSSAGTQSVASASIPSGSSHRTGPGWLPCFCSRCLGQSSCGDVDGPPHALWQIDVANRTPCPPPRHCAKAVLAYSVLLCLRGAQASSNIRCLLNAFSEN